MFDTQTLLGVLKYKVDELETIVNQISSGSSSGSENTISIPATQITLYNPSTGDTLTIQQARELIKIPHSLQQTLVVNIQIAKHLTCKQN
jgi:hypothetical protein